MKSERNNKCWCRSGYKYKNCHAWIDNRKAIYESKGHLVPTNDLLKNKKQIDGIRASGLINIAILDFIGEYVKVGISTEEINQLVHSKTIELGGIPAPLNYNGYPKSVCISINDVVCHGIPSRDLFLRDGDIVNIDVSTICGVFFSDSSRMYLVGDVSEEKKNLSRVAKECVELGIRKVRPWGFLGDIGQVINDYAEKNQYSVVREIGGHGVGLEFHEEPWVSYVSTAGTDMLLVPGMIFTIEPMINMGSAEVVHAKDGEWEVFTLDGKPSAQWESMVLVTDEGCEVLAY